LNIYARLFTVLIRYFAVDLDRTNVENPRRLE
jgi:hypothetical protein